jgi:hypothetical protein
MLPDSTWCRPKDEAISAWNDRKADLNQAALQIFHDRHDPEVSDEDLALAVLKAAQVLPATKRPDSLPLHRKPFSDQILP